MEQHWTAVMKAENNWGRFQQPNGAKRRQAFFEAVQFRQQHYTQLCQYTQLELMLNFYAVLFTQCVSKIGVNVLEQKLPVER
jgi:hypothetical protein